MKTHNEIIVDAYKIWDELNKALPYLEVRDYPTVYIKDMGCKTSAIARTFHIELNVNFLMTVPYKEYRNTIVHELCHVYVRRTKIKCKSHGELWQFLYNTVMGVDRGQYHNYDCSKAKKYKELSKLKRKIERLDK